MAKLILIRGIPGSGKSTMAKAMVEGTQARHIEADMYFVDPHTGKYEWDGMRIGHAHEWCIDRAGLYLRSNVDVVVSNTFTRLKEMRPYFELAKVLGVQVNVLLAQGAFQNIHGVPAHVLKNMKDRFEYDVSSLYAEYA
jgi:predicted kinase